MPTDDFASLIPWSLAVPAAAAVIVAVLGPRRRDAVRWVALAATLVTLLLVAVLAWHYASLPALKVGRTFQPRLTTSVDLLPLGHDARGAASAIRFFVGLDGLNVWLVLLTAVLMVPAVLVSWTAVTDRVNEYYAWLLLLAAGMMGVFYAFDIVLFYVFFELTLVPLFFLIGIWGGSQRQHAARKFFIYTLTGSLVTLLGVLGIVLACYYRSPHNELTFSIPRLVEIVQDRLRNAGPQEMAYWHSVQVYAFLALMAGFAIKVPLFPLHTWLPLAHVEAPTAGSVLLAGVLLKLGTYGILRLAVPLAPDAAFAIGAPIMGTLAVVGIIYGALCSYAQDDIKKLVAYSSVSHLGVCVLGLFALNRVGLSGSLIQMVNHGLSTGALFLLVGMLYERYHTRQMADYSGLAAKLKLLSAAMVFVALSSAGLPGLNGFWGEVLSLMGIAVPDNPNVTASTLTVLGATGVILGALYLITMLRKVFFGPLREPPHEGHGPVADLNLREIAALAPIVILCVALGVYPQPFFRVAEPDVGVVAAIADGARQRAAKTAPAPEADKQAAQAATAGEETR